jgi:hypothetical protein
MFKVNPSFGFYEFKIKWLQKLAHEKKELICYPNHFLISTKENKLMEIANQLSLAKFIAPVTEVDENAPILL